MYCPNKTKERSQKKLNLAFKAIISGVSYKNSKSFNEE
jgi:hypothetical protein